MDVRLRREQMTCERRLRAAAIGSCVPSEFRGMVCGWYPDVVNIRLPDGLLVSLLRRAEAMTALGILIPDLAPTVATNMAVRRRGARLRLADPASNQGQYWMTILTEDAFRWSARIAGGGGGYALRSTLPEMRRLLMAARRGLFCSLAGLESDPFGIRAARIVAEAEAAWRCEGLFRGLERLVGLGRGFTPSGDDFLAGALAAEALFMDAGRPVTIDRAAIAARLSATSDGGRTLLFLALRGEFSLWLVDLARAMAPVMAEDPAKLRHALYHAVKEASRHGATSGLDGSAGLYWRLTY